MRLREIYCSPAHYSVCSCDRTERLVLYVIAGGVAMYPVLVELLPEEESRFREDGHLDALARDVAKCESRYAVRTLRPQGSDDRIELVRAP